MDEKTLDLSKKSYQLSSENKQEKQESVEHIQPDPNRNDSFYEKEFSKSPNTSEMSVQQEITNSRLSSLASTRHNIPKCVEKIPQRRATMKTKMSNERASPRAKRRESFVSPSDTEKKHKPTRLSNSNCDEKSSLKYISSRPSSAGPSRDYNFQGIPLRSTKSKKKLNLFCQYCKKACSCQSEYEAHIRTHTGEKPFKCPHCDKFFSMKESVKVHMRFHTGERPFQCQECGKAFFTSGALKMHNMIHTGERPYICEICDKSFIQKIQLTLHMTIHD